MEIVIAIIFVFACIGFLAAAFIVALFVVGFDVVKPEDNLTSEADLYNFYKGKRG